MEHTTTAVPADAERLERLTFHVQTGDFFPMVATIFGFLEESVHACEAVPGELEALEMNVVQDMRKNLAYLHERYTIVPKEALA